jgi:hypothetical protein
MEFGYSRKIKVTFDINFYFSGIILSFVRKLVIRFVVIPVRLGWDPTARMEHDGASRGQKIFHQKNTCGEDGNPV